MSKHFFFSMMSFTKNFLVFISLLLWLIDEDIESKNTSEALQGLRGPMTRARDRKAKEAKPKMGTTIVRARSTCVLEMLPICFV